MINKWISVKDALPKEDSLVLAAINYGFAGYKDIALCNFYRNDFFAYTDGLEASNFDGGATIQLAFVPTHWYYVEELEFEVEEV